ncbi:MIF4G domain-containing protein B, partial [Anabarilius grahami]
EVSWKKTDEDMLVLLYQNNETQSDSSDERYRDRVEFFTDENPKGNFSLRLRSVRVEDKGVYMCQVFAGGLSANATVVLKILGFSVSHIMVLILCITASGSALLLYWLVYSNPEDEDKILKFITSSHADRYYPAFTVLTYSDLRYKHFLFLFGSAGLVLVNSAALMTEVIMKAGKPISIESQAEAKQTNGSVFRRNLLNRLQQEFKAREETRKRSTEEWVCLVCFICNIFDYLKVNNMPMMALVHPVYDCLFRLAQSDALKNEEEVDCLVLQLHRIGDQLEKMNMQLMDELFNLLRDGFLLQEDLSSMGRLLLLEILEFRAGGWTLSDTAQKYYYSEVTD